MSVPTSTVSGTLHLPSGAPAAYADVTFTLVGLGLVGLSLVMPRSVGTVCDVDGSFSIEVVPSPDGTYYDVSAQEQGGWSGQPFFTERSVVPAGACQLSQTLQTEPAPALDAAQRALLDLQTAMSGIEQARQSALGAAQDAGQSAAYASSSLSAAEQSAYSASQLADSAAADRDLTALDRAATEADRAATQLDHAATSADRAQTALDRAAAAADKAQTTLDRAATAADRAKTTLDRAATAADLAQTTIDRSGAAADRAQTALDRSGAAADRAQTALDRAATAADKVQTTLDKVATTADRAQTALDRAATAAALAAADLDKQGTASDLVQTTLDRASATADRVQTALDKAATAADRVQTALDRAATAADRAQTSLDKVATSTSAGNAAGSAASALMVYSTAAAMNAALATAAAQSNLAQTAAASASSILSQDLSAVSAALHRSPNAVTAMCIYDLQNDTDGGAWVEKVGHTSWMNESLCGSWLTGGFATELAARNYGAVLGAERNIDPDFNDTAQWAKSDASITVSGGKLNFTSTPTAKSASVARAVGAGIWQKVTVVVDSVTAGALSVQVNGMTSYSITAAGTYTLEGVTSTAGTVGIYTVGVTTAVVDSFSVRAVASQVTNTGDYFQLTTDGKFYKLNAGAGVTEVFRGNKAKFPRLAAIVAEAGSVTIYDLTEPGRPMWMRMKAVGTYSGYTLWYVSSSASCVMALNGVVAVGFAGSDTTNHGLITLDFAKDKPHRVIGTFLNYAGTLAGGIAARNSSATLLATNTTTLVNSNVNAVAMTVLPDAGIDVATGLQVPTIAVATAGGVSVIKHDGTVATKAYNSATCWAVSFDGYNLLVGGIGPDSWNGAWTWNLVDGSVQNYGKDAVVKLNNNGSGYKVVAQGKTSTAIQGASVNLLRQNKSTPGKSALSCTAPTHSSGYMLGDIRRAYLCNTEVESVSGAELGWATDSLSIANLSITPGFTYTETADRIRITRNSDTQVGYVLIDTAPVVPSGLYSINLNILAVSAGAAALLGATNGGAEQLISNGYVGGAFSGRYALTCSGNGNGRVRLYFSTARGASPAAGVAGDWIEISKTQTVSRAIADRSYKAAGASIYGTLVKSQVASAAQLVAYSGFSATNYIQETYSADLDYGVGEWSVGAWANVPAVLPTNYPVVGAEVIPDPSFDDASKWGTSGPWTVAGGVATAVSAASGTTVGLLTAARPTLAVGDCYLFEFTVDSCTAGGFALSNSNMSFPTGNIVSTPGVYRQYASVVTSAATIFSIRAVGTASGTISSFSAKRVGDLPIAERSSATGPSLKLGLNAVGGLTATAYDGTTTRTVTTTASYNTGIFTKARATYTAAGKLGITVNGVEVASTTGTPLLSISSRWNLLTYSEQFDNAFWLRIGLLTVAVGSEVSPLGRSTASKIVEDTSYGNHTFRPSGATTLTAGLYEGSVYLKAAERGYGAVQLTDSAPKRYGVVVNLTTGAVTASSLASSPTNTSVVVVNSGGGWWRVTLRMDFAAGAAYMFAGPSSAAVPTFSLALPSYTGDGVSGVYAFGADFRTAEQSSLPYQRVSTATDFDFQATLTIGNSRTLDAPFPGSITLFKTGATVPTVEQALWMYEQEKQMFRDGAQITLPAATAVTDLSYDESQDKWTAVQAGYESSFTGLIRTNAAVPSAGSFNKVDTKNGVKLLSRTTTSPGVDVTVPAMNLRAELVRRAEAAAKANRPEMDVDVDFIAAQTDYVAPAGYVVTGVAVARNKQREGATKDYVKLFDGFRETVRLNVAPGAAAWCQFTIRKE